MLPPGSLGSAWKLQLDPKGDAGAPPPSPSHPLRRLCYQKSCFWMTSVALGWAGPEKLWGSEPAPLGTAPYSQDSSLPGVVTARGSWSLCWTVQGLLPGALSCWTQLGQLRGHRACGAER